MAVCLTLAFFGRLHTGTMICVFVRRGQILALSHVRAGISKNRSSTPRRKLVFLDLLCRNSRVYSLTETQKSRYTYEKPLLHMHMHMQTLANILNTSKTVCSLKHNAPPGSSINIPLQWPKKPSYLRVLLKLCVSTNCFVLRPSKS